MPPASRAQRRDRPVPDRHMNGGAPVRVVFVLSDLIGDGTQTSTVQLARELNASGHEASIVVLDDRQPSIVDLARARDVPVDILATRRLRHRIPELRRLLRARRPDVVHTALWNADIAGRVAAMGTPARVVSSFVCSPNDGPDFWPATRRPPRGELKRLLDALTAHLGVDRFHAVSEEAAATNAASLRVARRRITIVERGRDAASLGARTPDRRRRVREELGLADDQPLILSSGRLDDGKGFDVLLRAVALVLEKHPDTVTVVAGRDGRATRSLRALRDELGLDDRAARFVGHRSDLPDLMAAADVFAFPSQTEGALATPSEALGIGTPLVMTRLPSTDGFIVDRTHALLVELGRPEPLADAILEVLRDPDAAEGRAFAGRALFDAHFSIEESARRMVSLYRDLLTRRRGWA